MASARHIEVVLFDVGGILIRLSDIDVWLQLTGDADEQAFWRRWLHCPATKAFDRGQCSIDEFARQMIKSHDLPIDESGFLALFCNLPGGLFEGALELVDDVAEHLQVGCFSNTNEVHWSQPCNQIVHKKFEHHFLSFEIGLVKPDIEAFQYVASAFDCAPEAVFFVDDNVINVDAAREFGFQAYVTKGPLETRRVLSDHGLMKI
ncbi:MAG: HAD-IA family hydrolase [Alphaproteobacteria bacterium]|jgi:glucose-1-phosphatase|nr:HAD-IA family hydrolase [Alphaproteobacteria bacterium]MBT4082836.1 HAD-IA family hydrolase [Alphaproteobacteria bacterium]MBT4542422.1 HAD-IA family hydrolase [Alphaproteobacteria bacterium]MBT7744983.1 HAD-IA family hydrolase [Alphaproteobacteria bacterium]